MPRGIRTTKKKKQVLDMDYSLSYSENNHSQSESLHCSPEKKHLTPPRRTSLRLANKAIEFEATRQHDDRVRGSRRASLRSTKKLNETRTASVKAYQVSECSVAEPEIRHEETEKVGDYVAPGYWLVDEAEMEGMDHAGNVMVSHSTQMEGHNACEEAHNTSLEEEDEPLGKAEAEVEAKAEADNNNSKSISMAEHTSSRFSLNLTEMVNMWGNNDGDEVNFFGQSSPKDTAEGYQVKPKFMPMLRKILNKHGDIFENSMVSTMTFQSMFLEVICDILSELEDKGLNKITEDELHNMIGLANEMKSMKVNIEWLLLRLEEILETRKILRQSRSLKIEKDRNKKAMEFAQKELECCEEEKKTLTAKFQQLIDRICDKETACKETLAITQDESARISQIISNAKSKVRRFVNYSLVDGLL